MPSRPRAATRTGGDDTQGRRGVCTAHVPHPRPSPLVPPPVSLYPPVPCARSAYIGTYLHCSLLAGQASRTGSIDVSSRARYACAVHSTHRPPGPPPVAPGATLLPLPSSSALPPHPLWPPSPPRRRPRSSPPCTPLPLAPGVGLLLLREAALPGRAIDGRRQRGSQCYAAASPNCATPAPPCPPDLSPRPLASRHSSPWPAPPGPRPSLGWARGRDWSGPWRIQSSKISSWQLERVSVADPRSCRISSRSFCSSFPTPPGRGGGFDRGLRSSTTPPGFVVQASTGARALSLSRRLLLGRALATIGLHVCPSSTLRAPRSTFRSLANLLHSDDCAPLTKIVPRGQNLE